MMRVAIHLMYCSVLPLCACSPDAQTIKKTNITDDIGSIAPQAAKPDDTDPDLYQIVPPVQVTGVYLDADNANVRCDFRSLGDSTHQVNCRMLVIAPSGQEVTPVGILSGVSVVWSQEPVVISGRATILGCALADGDLVQICTVEAETPAVALRFSTTIADSARSRTVTDEVLLPFSVGVAAGFVPTMPIAYGPTTGGDTAKRELSLTDVADGSENGSQTGFQLVQMQPESTIDHNIPIRHICAPSPDRVFFSSQLHVYVYEHGMVKLYAGSPLSTFAAVDFADESLRNRLTVRVSGRDNEAMLGCFGDVVGTAFSSGVKGDASRFDASAFLFRDVGAVERRLKTDGDSETISGVALGPNNILYVSEFSTGRILRFDSQGSTTEIFGPALRSRFSATIASEYFDSYVNDVTTDRQGNVYSLHRQKAQRVYFLVRVDLDGSIMVTDIPGVSDILGTGPFRLAASSFEKVFVLMHDGYALFTVNMRTGERSDLVAVDSDRSETPHIDSLGIKYSIDIALDPLDNIYLADKYRIIRIDGKTGEVLRLVGVTDLAYAAEGPHSLGPVPAEQRHMIYPNGLAYDGQGNLFIADSSYRRVYRLDATGLTTTVVAGGNQSSDSPDNGDGGLALGALLKVPWGLAVTPQNTLVIAEYGGHRLRSVDLATGRITTIAGTGVDAVGGEGPASATAISYPHDPVVDPQGNILFWQWDDSQRVTLWRFRSATGQLEAVISGSAPAGYPSDAALENVSLTGLAIRSTIQGEHARVTFTPEGEMRLKIYGMLFRVTEGRLQRIAGCRSSCSGNSLLTKPLGAVGFLNLNEDVSLVIGNTLGSPGAGILSRIDLQAAAEQPYVELFNPQGAANDICGTGRLAGQSTDGELTDAMQATLRRVCGGGFFTGISAYRNCSADGSGFVKVAIGQVFGYGGSTPSEAIPPGKGEQLTYGNVLSLTVPCSF